MSQVVIIDLDSVIFPEGYQAREAARQGAWRQVVGNVVPLDTACQPELVSEEDCWQGALNPSLRDSLLLPLAASYQQRLLADQRATAVDPKVRRALIDARKDFLPLRLWSTEHPAVLRQRQRRAGVGLPWPMVINRLEQVAAPGVFLVTSKRHLAQQAGPGLLLAAGQSAPEYWLAEAYSFLGQRQEARAERLRLQRYQADYR